MWRARDISVCAARKAVTISRSNQRLLARIHLPTIGVYRFWRDMGYVTGGLLAGAAADIASFDGAIALVAGLTAVSGLWVWLELPLRNVQAPLDVAGWP